MAPSKKKIAAQAKFQVSSGSATPAPPVGTALGPHGINIQDFCKNFNDQTSSMEKGLPLPVIVTIYADRSFSFVIKTPPASFLIKKALNLKSGSATPHTTKVGKLSRQQTEAIAQEKMADLNTHTLDAAVKIIEGTARSMGVETEAH